MLKKTRKRGSLLRVVLLGATALTVAVVVSVGVGSTSIPLSDVVRALLAACRILPQDAVDPAVLTVVVSIRLPRVLCGALAGSGLAMAGAVMQGVFRNPLADPGLLGVSAGSGFGALVAITSGVASFFLLPAAAFIGALAAVGAILGVSALTKSGRTSPVTLVMSGMAVSALFGAFTSLVLSVSNEYQVTSYLFWTMGGLANRRWEHVLTMLVPVLSCAAAMVLLSGRLDVMLLGDEQARALGIHSGRNRVALVLITSMCTAAIVCVTGPIGFVGLIVPHIMRMLVGPSHRRLCLASAFAGGVFLTLCDSLVRFVSGMRGKEFSVGIVTALLGAPYFLFLLARRGGGEAED